MAKIKRTEKVEKEVVVQTRCDICRKIAEGDGPAGWTSISSGHSEWGNDSVDSYDQHDVCSFVCFLAAVREVHSRYGDMPSLYVNARNFDREFIADMLETVDAV